MLSLSWFGQRDPFPHGFCVLTQFKFQSSVAGCPTVWPSSWDSPKNGPFVHDDTLCPLPGLSHTVVRLTVTAPTPSSGTGQAPSLRVLSGPHFYVGSLGLSCSSGTQGGWTADSVAIPESKVEAVSPFVIQPWQMLGIASTVFLVKIVQIPSWSKG